MALLNNWLELRSDAFKITTHVRRPIPTRTDTIGPWLESLVSHSTVSSEYLLSDSIDFQTFITWLAALTNSALVYLFRPTWVEEKVGTLVDTSHLHTHMPLNSTSVTQAASPSSFSELIIPATLIALSASHGYILARLFIKHILERLFWKGSNEEARAELADKQVKEQYLRSLGLDKEEDGGEVAVKAGEDNLDQLDATGFWRRDEGMDEIQKAVKDA